MRLQSILVPLIVAVIVAGAGLLLKSDQPAAAPMSSSVMAKGHGAAIGIANYNYEPIKLTVSEGTKITVTNRDQTAHTVTARSAGFDSGTIGAGQSKTFTAAKPGVYAYYCQFHAFMNGTITVTK